MKPYYEHGGIEIYKGDCFEIMPKLPPFNTIITDPPYGMGNNTDSSRFSGGTAGHIAKRGNGGRFKGQIHGDDRPFDPSPFLSVPNIILWGYNYFSSKLPTGSTLIWIKRLDNAFGTFLSDAELAWMKGGKGVYCKRDLSLLSQTRNRLHPNQKPLPLLTWCIELIKDTGAILDPFMGSGSTLVASKQLGRKAIGIEIEEKYCEIAANRLAQDVLPLWA